MQTKFEKEHGLYRNKSQQAAALVEQRDELQAVLAELVEAVGRSGWHHSDPLISNRTKRADLLNRARNLLPKH
jgi:hypothetical protein